MPRPAMPMATRTITRTSIRTIMRTTTRMSMGATTRMSMGTTTRMSMGTTLRTNTPPVTRTTTAMHRTCRAPAAATTMGLRTITDTITTTTGAAITTTTDGGDLAASGALLQLLWLASPALPVGAFSYSEGLEAAIDAGLATGEDGVRRWLLDQLWLVQARSEGPLLAAALQAWRDADLGRVDALNAWALATRESGELRQQAEQMGRSLADWLTQRADADDPRVAHLRALRPAPTWPVAAALAAARSGADARAVLLALTFGWAENMVQAAVKAVPLGQNAGQRLLAALVAEIPAAVDHALALADDERQAFSPGLSILSARHEVQYSRLFRS